MTDLNYETLINVIYREYAENSFDCSTHWNEYERTLEKVEKQTGKDDLVEDFISVVYDEKELAFRAGFHAATQLMR